MGPGAEAERHLTMCLAIPVQITSIDEGSTATASMGGVRKKISLALLDGVTVGDWVIVHTGYALSRLDPGEAEKTLALLRDAGVTP